MLPEPGLNNGEKHVAINWKSTLLRKYAMHVYRMLDHYDKLILHFNNTIDTFWSLLRMVKYHV